MSETDEILAQIDEAIEDWSVGPDAMRCGAPAGSGLTSTLARPRVGAVSVTVDVDLSGMRRAMADFAAQMAKIADAMNRTVAANPGLRRLLGLPQRDEHHHPPALCIDGAAYHRRRSARRRRR